MRRARWLVEVGVELPKFGITEDMLVVFTVAAGERLARFPCTHRVGEDLSLTSTPWKGSDRGLVVS